MLVRPSDAPLDEAEWRAFLAAHDFGQLVAHAEPWPVVAPTHFALDGDRALMHFAKDNPVLAALRADARAVLAVVGDYVYVPGTWNAGEEADARHGVPTSYYAAVQLRGEARVLDDAAELARLLNATLDRFEPPGADAVERMAPGDPRVPLLAAIRGVELRVTDVRAKFKYGGNRPREHRMNVARHLAERAGPLDDAARDHLLRRSATR